MWIASNHGFFSIVRHHDTLEQPAEQGRWLVRARRLDDLQRLLDAAGVDEDIHDDLGTDYPVRAFVDHEELGRVFTELEDSISYSNFKNAVAAGPCGPERASLYGRVWQLLGNGLGWARSGRLFA